MGNWRNEFCPETHLGLGYSPVHKLLMFRQKEARLQRQSLSPLGGKLRLSYEHLVLMTARRLIKSGRDINLGSPDRELFETFKEKFWFQSIYKSHHGKLEKQVSLQKAWFFFHVYETVENYKARCTAKSWRPWLDPVIDVCNSSSDECEPPSEKPDILNHR